MTSKIPKSWFSATVYKISDTVDIAMLPLLSTYRIRYRKGEVNMRTNNNGTIWTVKMLKFFSDLCEDETRTFRSIMKAMNAEFGTNLSRNACIGKARRLKAPPRAVVNNPVPRPEGLPLDKLRSRSCRWPLGPTMQRPPYFYCGKLTMLGCPYCREHTKAAHSKAIYIAKTSLPA
jgi:hypothetical protein